MYKLTLLLLLVTTSLMAQIPEKYKKGCYYDNNGKKMSGYIYYRYDFKKYIKFIHDSISAPKKLGVYEVSAFKIASDSFTVINNFYFEGVGGGLGPINHKDFVKVLQIGKINMYEHYSTQGSGNTSFPSDYSLVNHILKSKDSNVYVTARRRNAKKFRKGIFPLLSDYPALIDEINERELTVKDIDYIVTKFNKH